MFKDFTEMPVWNHAMDIAVQIFRITDSLPRKEDYALTSQIRRSAESISANISEGFGRGSAKEKCQFYRFARGSSYETKNHLIYGFRVGYLQNGEVQNLNESLDQLIFELNKIMKTLTQPQS